MPGFALVIYTGDIRQPVKTRNSSGDEIANVNFLYDDIVHLQPLLRNPPRKLPNSVKLRSR